MDDVNLLRPVPASLRVQVHPHTEGDVVSVVMVDAATGHRHLLATDPDTAYRFGLDLIEATTSETVAAEADRIRDNL